MRRLYEDFISVDSDFIPVFSEHGDKQYPNKWKSFYPHDSFKSIVSQLIDTLEKGNTSKDLPIWMHGAYGTGKTFASFVIKHILEDDLKDIEAYCVANDMKSLYARIAGVRNKGRILVVHRSSSSGIVGDNKLFNCITTSVKDALQRNGYSYKGSQSQYDIILRTLKDPGASYNFANAFEKYSRKFEGFAEPISVIKDLEELGPDNTLDLLETIVEVSELEHYHWSTTYTDVINWLNDVRKKNNIYAIVFVWDEFTEFFKNNQSNISGLQEIAHAASSINFYFFLITHSGSQIINDQNSKKIIEARFKIRSIDMAETTAFKLMGQAIKHEHDLDAEWESVENELWGRVELSTKKTILSFAKDTSSTELKMLLPIHPYAAYLLKIISSEISSNQRTMFQFLSGDYLDGDKEKHNFKWFIHTHSNETGQWNYLTTDYIWDYFFTDDNVDLNDAFKQAISQYENYAPICVDNDSRLKVLKVALLLSAIQQRSGTGRIQGQSTLLRATLNNISTAFVGTPIQTMVANIMAEFVAKGVFSTIQDGNDTLYIPPVNNINQERFNKMFDEIKKNIPFEKLIADGASAITEHFLPNDYLKYRFKIFPVTLINYKAAMEQARNLCVNQIPAFYLFALDEKEQTKSLSIANKIIEELGRKAVVVDFSETPFSSSSYDKYLQSRTEERYYGEDTSQGKLAKQNAEQITKSWKTKLYVTHLTVYPKVEGISQQVQGGGNLRNRLKEYNGLWFGCGLEEISVMDKLFAPTGFKETVAQMAMNRIPIPPNYSYLNQISIKLTNEQIWTNADYVKAFPDHVVSQMKKCVEGVIAESFGKNSRVAITDIWEALKAPPFGLFSCTGSVFLLGFLLKEYADGVYYKFDGANTVALNHTDLSDLIFSVIKELPKAKNQFIVKQKPEHIEFCRISGTVFKIAKDKQNSIQDIAKNISVFLKNNEYPLWSLEHYVIDELDNGEMSEAIISAIKLYCELVSTNKMAGRDSTKVAEEMYMLYKQNAGLDSKLEELVRVENMKRGMAYYIASYNPDLITITRQLGISEQSLLMELNCNISADSSYLWDIGDTNQQIDNLLDEYLLIQSTNSVLSEKKSNIADAVEALTKKLNLIRIPDAMIQEENPPLGAVLKYLYSIKNNTVINKQQAAQLLEAGAASFNEFFVNQYEVFTTALKKRLHNVSVDELTYLFENVEAKALFDMPDEYIIKVNAKLKSYRKNKKINQLLKVWQDATGTISPDEWSKRHRICILMLFENEVEQATHTFELINGKRIAQAEEEINAAISFVNTSVLPVITELENCNKQFIIASAGDYAYVIENATEYKSYLVEKLGSDAFKWAYNRKSLKAFVEEYANRKYNDIYKPKVVEKIKDLAPDEVQKLLVVLIEGKTLVGINILKM